MSGTLHIVSTPIGNLGDVSSRAKEVLEDVELIAAEDTRRTGRLLKSLGVSTKMWSYHDHNKEQRVPAIVERLVNGEDVALVSDAGTPGIADPAFRLVLAAIAAEVEVLPVPGPSACLAALVVSGLPTDRFAFEGFLPRKPGRRQTRIEEFLHEPRTVVLYESPHRVAKVLRELADLLGSRKASVSRELTKVFEETKRGTLGELAAHWEEVKPRGEFVVVIEGCSKDTKKIRKNIQQDDEV